MLLSAAVALTKERPCAGFAPLHRSRRRACNGGSNPRVCTRSSRLQKRPDHADPSAHGAARSSIRLKTIGNDPVKQLHELAVLLGALPEVHETADELDVFRFVMSIAVDTVGRSQHVVV